MEWTRYTTKEALKDNDELMILDTDGKANKRTLMNKVWNYVVDKMTTAVIAKLGTTNKTLIGAVNELNSNQVFNNLLIYRTSGANIKSVTISVNKDGYENITYAPFVLFGDSVFLTGTIGAIDDTLKTGDVTIERNNNGSIQNVKFSNFPPFINAVIIIYCKNIKNAIVKEE